jgi:prepilin-type N-terminal cleavage/methylation domain-containing protein
MYLQKLGKMRNQEGFTLIELMIVVAIISILATLALPRFQVFQAKALRSEATYNLGVVATYQEAHKIENAEYAVVPEMGITAYDGSNADSCNTTNDIGFVLSNCAKVKYDYGTVTGSADATGFEAEAQSDVIVNGETDCLSIDQNRTSTIVNDAIKAESNTCGTLD